jgi:CPA2 family monovalent cation:H+ antiporter-2
METVGILQDLAIVLLVSGLAVLVFQILNLPRVAGFILAGVLIGPHTPPFSLISNEASIRTLADLGVIFLMLSLGLEFNLRRLFKAGFTALITAILDVTIMVWLGYRLGQWLGWTPLESLFLGAILCDSSTTILGRIIEDMGWTREPFAGVVFGITLVEDLLAVVLIAMLNGIVLTGSVQAGAVAGQVWQLVIFLVAVGVGGMLTLPRFLDYLGKTRSDELIVVTLVGICFGITLVAVKLQLSLALGAVLIGAVASETRGYQRLSSLIDPLRYVFSAVFFVSVGLMLDPTMLLQYTGPIFLAVVVIVGAKFLNGMAGTLLSGHDLTTAVRTGAGLAQIGEFAFIIAALGISLNATGDRVYQVGVAAAVITILINPYLLRASTPLANRLAASSLFHRWTTGFQAYSHWSATIRTSLKPSPIRRAVRRSIITILINLALIAALFSVASYFGRHHALLPVGQDWSQSLYTTALWLAAVLLALPLYIAVIRKLDALAMLLAEVGVPPGIGGTWAQPMRAFVARAILLGGCVGLGLLTFILSSTILPPFYTLLVLLCLVTLIAWQMWHWLSVVYSRAQSSLQAVMRDTTQETLPSPARPEPIRDNMLDLELKPLIVPEGSPFVGRHLRQIRLRNLTGASVVGIEREGRQLTNPSPTTILQARDRLFLMGSPDQITSAQALLDIPQKGKR